MLWGQKPLYATPLWSHPLGALVGVESDIVIPPQPQPERALLGGGSGRDLQTNLEADDAEVELLAMQALAVLSG